MATTLPHSGSMRPAGLRQHIRRHLDLYVAASLWILWCLIHLTFVRTFIFHDSWQHIYPITHRIWDSMDGLRLPMWLGNVDSGTPLVLYVSATSAMQILRLPELYVGELLRPNITGGLYLHKSEILLSYCLLCAGMYVLGRVLYQHRLPALYLAIATLFAGEALDATHSDEHVSILFWIPWALACGALYHQYRRTTAAARYLNIGTLFLVLGGLDQYPHFPALAGAVAVLVYCAMFPRDTWTWLRTNAWRLWPALLVLIAFAGQLLIVRLAIDGYRPGLRPDTLVDPNTMGSTGFVQPSSFLGTLIPLTFLATIDILEPAVVGHIGYSPFDYRLDLLNFGLGFVPLVFATAFMLGHASVRTRVAWVLPAAVLLLISLQDSRLYFLLFRLPFFDLFRVYFQYFLFTLVIVLVMSGYGLDLLLRMSRRARRSLLFRSLIIVSALTAAAVAVELWMLFTFAYTNTLADARATWPYAVGDALGVSISAIAILWAARTRLAERAALGAMAALAVSQSIYFVGAYQHFGIPTSQVVERLGIDDTARKAQADEFGVEAGNLERHECTIFAECYLAGQDTASLQLDAQSPLWRSINAPVFRKDLNLGVVKGISGITHSVFWFSLRAVPYDDASEMVAALNAGANTIEAELAGKVYVQTRDLGTLGQTLDGVAAAATITGVTRDLDRFRVSYHADGPALLNAAVTFDDAWSAHIDSQPLSVVRGNFDGLLVPVPAGDHLVELTYSSPPQNAFFVARIAMLLAAIVGVYIVAKVALTAKPTGTYASLRQHS
jgi:hypothetical protein